MQDSFDPTTLIFIALALFVAWRLRSVLGQKTGHEKPTVDPLARRAEQARPGEPAREPANVVRLPGAERPAPAGDRWAGIAAPNSPNARALDAMANIEPGFDARGFMEGAKSAYEMIVMGFATGDRKMLKSLLSKDVYEGFERAISDREAAGQKAETTFVAIENPELTNAELRGRVAQLTVRFHSKLITATRDASGVVVDGSPDMVADVTEIWTFARTLGTRDPNWLLVATEAGQ